MSLLRLLQILREKGTEMAGTGEYDKHYPDKVSSGAYLAHFPLRSQQRRVRLLLTLPLIGLGEQGVYECAGCGTPLYTADMSESSIRSLRNSCSRVRKFRILRGT